MNRGRNAHADHHAPVTFVAAGPHHGAALSEMFAELRAHGDERWFHPFPLDDASAASIVREVGRDRYRLAVDGSSVLAIGMLRGWDAGYETPSLGIAVRPSAQGRGIGRAMMLHLHDQARDAGAVRVRLSVDQANQVATALYASLGYVFAEALDGRLIGTLDVSRG